MNNTYEYDYAVRLATYMWEKYYKDIAPEWEPLDTLIGVLTQIDNMIAGMDTDCSGDNDLPLVDK